MTLIIILILLAVLIWIIIQASNGNAPLGGIPISNIISHWSHFFHSFNISSNSFYTELEDVLKSHEMPHSVISRTMHKEGGMLSASREYLRIKHGDIVFDVCAAPFGHDFFISWWLYETSGTVRHVLKHTKFGNYLNARASRRTFYQADEEEMFRSCVHGCILEAVEKVTLGKSIRALTDKEKAFTMGGM